MNTDNWIEAQNKPQATQIDPVRGKMWSDYVLLHIFNDDNRYDELGARVLVGYYHYLNEEWHDIKDNVLKGVSHWMPLAMPRGL
jgi:hypothetical protein